MNVKRCTPLVVSSISLVSVSFCAQVRMIMSKSSKWTVVHAWIWEIVSCDIKPKTIIIPLGVFGSTASEWAKERNHKGYAAVLAYLCVPLNDRYQSMDNWLMSRNKSQMFQDWQKQDKKVYKNPSYISDDGTHYNGSSFFNKSLKKYTEENLKKRTCLHVWAYQTSRPWRQDRTTRLTLH